jgi:hypothetical protein
VWELCQINFGYLIAHNIRWNEMFSIIQLGEVVLAQCITADHCRVSSYQDECWKSDCGD